MELLLSELVLVPAPGEAVEQVQEPERSARVEHSLPVAPPELERAELLEQQEFPPVDPAWEEPGCAS